MRNKETPPIPGINKTSEELEESLRAGIEALVKSLQDKLHASVLQEFVALKLSIDIDNEKAKEKLEEDLKVAVKEPDFLRDHYIDSLNNTYRIFLEARIWLLENFKKKYSL